MTRKRRRRVSKDHRLPENIEDLPAWYAAKIEREATQRLRGRETGSDRQDDERRDATAERIAWAIEHPDQASEVGVTVENRVRRYELEIVDGVPRLRSGS